MQPVWQALLDLIGGNGGTGMDTPIALIVAGTAFIVVFTMLYMLGKFLSLPQEPVTSAQPDAQGAAEPEQQTATSQAPQTRQEYVASLEGTKQVLRKIYRAMRYAIVGAFVLAGIYFYRISTAGNGLILVSMILLAVGFAVWAGMTQFLKYEQELSSWSPGKPVDSDSDSATLWGQPIKISKTVNIGEPSVVKLETELIKTARELLQAGSDMDTVCRQINPEYASWGSLERQLFRETMEAVLKAQAPASQ